MNDVIDFQTFKKSKGETMIKIKLEEIREIVPGIGSILMDHLPIKASYWISKLAKKMDKEFKHFEEARMILIKKYGEVDEKGELVIKDNQYIFKDRESFDKEFTELRATEIEIDFNPIPLSMLGECQVTPASLLALDKFIDDTK